MGTQSLKTLKHIAGTVLDAVLPPRCVVTGDIVDMQGMVAPQIWRDLRFIGEPLCRCCGIPFDFDVGEAARCASCLDEAPPYTSARAALIYDDTSREMVLRFKHADQTHAVHAFTPWLKRAGADMLSEADLLLPVPMHRFRLLRRRYNQAALIAQALALDTDLECRTDVLARVKATPTQGHLSFKDRHQNVKNAFIVPDKAREVVKGKTVILVDDVFTSGATAKECTKALLAAGAAVVHILCVARVVKQA